MTTSRFVNISSFRTCYGLLILQSHWDICSLMYNRDFTKPPRSCSAVWPFFWSSARYFRTDWTWDRKYLRVITSVSSWLNGSIRRIHLRMCFQVFMYTTLFVVTSQFPIARSFSTPDWSRKDSSCFSILIILSTMFLKQHSVVDVVAACVMAYFLYTLIYAQEGAKSPRLARQVI